MPLIAGIDGCRGGWLCVILNISTNSIRSQIVTRIDEILAITPPIVMAFIDIPIGLTDSGPRGCDIEARKKLGRPRGSSVFPAPIRPMLAATTYAEACWIGEEVDGRKLSRQTWNIMPKIREVDEFLQRSPSWKRRLRETHPELSFLLWNGSRAMVHGKKTLAGRAERESLVRSRYASAFDDAIQKLPRREYVRDDLLDAFAALWSVERLTSGQAIAFSSDLSCDAEGLEMAIRA